MRSFVCVYSSVQFYHVCSFIHMTTITVKIQNFYQKDPSKNDPSSFPFIFYHSKRFHLFYFQREEKGGRKREGKTSRCERNIGAWLFLHTPNRGPGLQPRPVPWPVRRLVLNPPNYISQDVKFPFFKKKIIISFPFIASHLSSNPSSWQPLIFSPSL